MYFSDQEKKSILKGFISIFDRIANKEYQKRIWIRGEGPECDDFDDTVCDFFGECDSILENYKSYKITESQYLLLKKFRDEFQIFSDENDLPQEFIDTSEWAKVIEMAKEILKAFGYKKVDLNKDA